VVERRGGGLIPAGDAAKGYVASGVQRLRQQLPVVKEIEKFVYAKGKGEMEDRSRVRSNLLHRAWCFGIISTEAIRTAQEKIRQGRPMTGDEIRWGLEHLSIDDRKLKQLGATALCRRSRFDAWSRAL